MTLCWQSYFFVSCFGRRDYARLMMAYFYNLKSQIGRKGENVFIKDWWMAKKNWFSC